MKNKPQWVVSDLTDAKHLGTIEFKDSKGEFHDFELMETAREKGNHKIVFGGACNMGFLESGYIHVADCETTDDALQELLSDLNIYYSDGAQYVSRIICNERM